MNRPDAHELLGTAQTLLIDQILPAVPDNLRYEVRMIASAMGIAARQAKDGAAIDSAEKASLLSFLADAEGGSLADSRAALAAAIRAGRFDGPGPERQQLEKVLLENTLDALSISNPKVITATAGQR